MGVSLSEVERKMLYFSETASSLPDIAEVNDAFDREYDQAKYEQKIASLIRTLHANNRADNQDEFDAWTEALRTLRQEDHYLLVLIHEAGVSVPAGRFLKLCVIAVAITFAVMVVAAMAMRR